MREDLKRELSAARATTLRLYPNHKVDEAVRKQLGTAAQAFQGLDAEDDGVTRFLWEQAVEGAYQDDVLTGFDDDVTWALDQAAAHVAARVREAMFALGNPDVEVVT